MFSSQGHSGSLIWLEQVILAQGKYSFSLQESELGLLNGKRPCHLLWDSPRQGCLHPSLCSHSFHQICFTLFICQSLSPQTHPPDYEFFRALQSVLSFRPSTPVPFIAFQVSAIKQILLANVFALQNSQTLSQPLDQSDAVHGSLSWNTRSEEIGRRKVLTRSEGQDVSLELPVVWVGE